jgi:glycine hydroxymethyltransferase
MAAAFLPGFDDQGAAALRERVQVLTDRFPLYPVNPQPAAQEAGQ